MLFMKSNAATRNAEVARTYVEAQQLKGWFMARAQSIAVFLSGAMMFTGVILMYSGVRLEWNQQTLLALLATWPVAIVAAPIAILVEGMTIISSNGLKEAIRKIEQELNLLNRTRKAYTEAEFKQRERKIKAQRNLPSTLLVIFMLFSLAGAEIFWHTLTENSGIFFQVIGFVIGAVTSVSLTYIEINGELIERGIDRTIASTAMIYRAMEQDMKGGILAMLSGELAAQMQTPEVVDVISRIAKELLYGPLAEVSTNMGRSVEAEQLQRIAEGKIAEREAADALLAGGQDTAALPSGNVTSIAGGRKAYRTEAGRKCDAIVKKYGRTEVEGKLAEYAKEAGVSPTTLRKYLSA
jgi:uncharacterized membrane protein YecN with MAPEG domain